MPSSRSTRGGQPRVPKKLKGDVAERLRAVMTEFMGLRTYEDFAQALGVPRSTVTRWFGNPPTTPATAQILRIAARANIQPTWLLLGEGPELLGADHTLGQLGKAVYDHITGVLTRELHIGKGFVEAVVASPVGLMEDLLGQHRTHVESMASRKLQAEKRQAESKSLLAAAFRHLRRKEVAELVENYEERLATREDEELRRLPAVEPWSDVDDEITARTLLSAPPIPPIGIVR